MPNLSYDPKNPADLFGKPLQPGDSVLWATTYGRSAAMAIAEIADIYYFKQVDYSRKRCERHEAQGYYLMLKVVGGTGGISDTIRRVEHVKNVVKFDG